MLQKMRTIRSLLERVKVGTNSFYLGKGKDLYSRKSGKEG